MIHKILRPNGRKGTKGTRKRVKIKNSDRKRVKEAEMELTKKIKIIINKLN